MSLTSTSRFSNGSLDILDYASGVSHLKRKTSKEWSGPCPLCGGEDRFVVFVDDKPGWICRKCNPDRRGSLEDLIMKVENVSFPEACRISGRHLDRPDTYSQKINGIWRQFPINATYDYVDQHGRFLFQVIRFTTPDGNRKNFGQRKKNPQRATGWEQNIKGCLRVPYRLPQLLKAIQAKKSIFVVEGEKCVELLFARGLVATTNVGGAGMGRKIYADPEYCAYFKGARLIIVADNDKAGIAHAQMIAARLRDIAEKIDLRLSGKWESPEGKQGLDDWILSGGSPYDLPSLPIPESNSSNGFLSGAPSDHIQDFSEKSQKKDKSIKKEEEEIATPRRINRVGATDEPILEECNDIAMSRYVASRLSGKWMFVFLRNKWLRWSGSHWEITDNEEIHSAIREIIEQMPDFRNRYEDQAKYLSFVAKYYHREKRAALINDLKSEKGISISPDRLDRIHHILPCQNGYIDLRSGRLFPHDPGLLYSYSIPIDYSPDAKCPNWENFLEQILPNPNIRAFMARYFGYCMTGESLDLAILLYGNGANGKSTITNVVASILGRLATQIDSSIIIGNQMGKNYDLAKLEGARMCQIKELPFGALRSDAFKKIIDNGALSIERKYEHPYDIDRTHSMILHSNHLPRISDFSDAPWRRLALIEFNEAIPIDKRIPNFDKILYRQESSGILAWLVAQAREYYQNGLIIPEEIQASTQRYREQEDSVLEWIRARCVFSPSARISSRAAYEDYFEYAEKAVSVSAFAARIKNLGIEKKEGRVSGRVVQCFFGIGLKEDKGDNADQGADKGLPPAIQEPKRALPSILIPLSHPEPKEDGDAKAPFIQDQSPIDPGLQAEDEDEDEKDELPGGGLSFSQRDEKDELPGVGLSFSQRKELIKKAIIWSRGILTEEELSEWDDEQLSGLFKGDWGDLADDEEEEEDRDYHP